jgi:hypothetical protein
MILHCMLNTRTVSVPFVTVPEIARILPEYLSALAAEMLPCGA